MAHAEVREVERCGAEPPVGHEGGYWRSYDNDLSSGEQALAESLRAFPSWFHTARRLPAAGQGRPNC